MAPWAPLANGRSAKLPNAERLCEPAPDGVENLASMGAAFDQRFHQFGTTCSPVGAGTARIGCGYVKGVYFSVQVWLAVLQV